MTDRHFFVISYFNLNSKYSDQCYVWPVSLSRAAVKSESVTLFHSPWTFTHASSGTVYIKTLAATLNLCTVMCSCVLLSFTKEFLRLRFFSHCTELHLLPFVGRDSDKQGSFIIHGFYSKELHFEHRMKCCVNLCGKTRGQFFPWLYHSLFPRFQFL